MITRHVFHLQSGGRIVIFEIHPEALRQLKSELKATITREIDQSRRMKQYGP